MIFNKRQYQALMQEHLYAHPRAALWADMGLGKTSATLDALINLSSVEDIFPILVIGTKRVALTVWTDEIAKWDRFRGIDARVVVGTMQECVAELEHSGTAELYTTNYERLPWLIDRLGKKWPFKTIVADESTRLKNFRLYGGGKRAKELARVAHAQCERFIEFTGTPTPNGLLDLWGQAWFLDRGRRLGRTITSFRDRWFRPNANGFGFSPLPFAMEQITRALGDICLSIKAEDWLALDAPVHTTLHVDLPTSARRLYNDMENKFFAEIEGVGIEAFNAGVKTMKLLQLANGAIYTDGERWKEVHDAKLQALEDVVEEAAGAPILVAYQFKSDLSRLRKAFPGGRVLDANKQTLRDWNNSDIPVLFAHPASAGHGLNLQDGGNRIAFFGHWWNMEERMQLIERIGPVRQLQSGHKRPVYIYDIVARNTADELVMARHATKRSVHNLLMEAMKTRRAL